ncbi:MAG: hypothetical protein IJX04_06095 [Oscillospiraceae bacterium]|nr:hypothetical protein [Oscillospiraceae bacterium]
MARNNYDRYVRFYTFGSTAVKVEDPRRTAKLPKYCKPEKRKPIPFDPVAFAGSIVAVFLAVLMIVGLFQVTAANAQVRELETQLIGLQQQEQMLMDRYYGSIDLEEVRVAAEFMGMIPAEEAAHVQIQVPAQTVQVQTLSWWDTMLASLRQFFA